MVRMESRQTYLEALTESSRITIRSTTATATATDTTSTSAKTLANINTTNNNKSNCGNSLNGAAAEPRSASIGANESQLLNQIAKNLDPPTNQTASETTGRKTTTSLSYSCSRSRSSRRIIKSSPRSTLLIGSKERRGVELKRKEEVEVEAEAEVERQRKLPNAAKRSHSASELKVGCRLAESKPLDYFGQTIQRLVTDAKSKISDTTTIEAEINCNNSNKGRESLTQPANCYNNNNCDQITNYPNNLPMPTEVNTIAKTSELTKSNKMVDQKRKSLPNKNSPATVSTATTATASTLESGNSNNNTNIQEAAGDSSNPRAPNDMNNRNLNAPSYQSLYAQQQQQQYQNRRLVSHSPDRQMNTNSNGNAPRHSIRRQEATAQHNVQPQQILESSLDDSPSRGPRQYSNFNYADSKLIDDEDDELDDEDEDYADEIEDKNSYQATNHNNTNNRQRALLDRPNSSQQQLIKSHSQQKLHSAKQQQHPSRTPPNQQQHPNEHSNQQGKKSNWLDQNIYLQNQRTNSKDSHKIAMIEGPYRYPAEMYHAKHAKTRTCILVLKFFVLLLLTLLLLLLLTGMIMAGRYLPRAFEEVMSAPRTFNVTISG